MNVAEYKHQPFGKDLAQFGEIVLHNLIESMRVQDLVDVGEYVVDVAASPAWTCRARSQPCQGRLSALPSAQIPFSSARRVQRDRATCLFVHP
jgi:hypothetical protein